MKGKVSSPLQVVVSRVRTYAWLVWVWRPFTKYIPARNNSSVLGVGSKEEGVSFLFFEKKKGALASTEEMLQLCFCDELAEEN